MLGAQTYLLSPEIALILVWSDHGTALLHHLSRQVNSIAFAPVPNSEFQCYLIRGKSRTRSIKTNVPGAKAKNKTSLDLMRQFSITTINNDMVASLFSPPILLTLRIPYNYYILFVSFSLGFRVCHLRRRRLRRFVELDDFRGE
jgi:hypothetical protein